MKTIKVGTRFRYTIADGNPEWEVIEKVGRGVWKAVVVEGPDYVGTQRAFFTKQIQGSLAGAEHWKKSADQSKAFFASLKVGDIVHYKNVFNAYVRCAVTRSGGLLPIALVGEWKSFDLPTRYIDGTVYLGYHAQNIKDKKIITPHCSNVWEFSRKGMDPRKLDPISLELPPMTPEEEVQAKKWQKINKIRNFLQSPGNDPDMILQTVQGMLGG